MCTCMECLASFLDVVISCLKVSSSGCSSLKDTSWAISATVLTLNVLVRLMTVGMMSTSTLRVPWICMASLRGS